MLEVTLEYNGLRAENLALRGKTKTLEAEQAVQLENAEVSVVGYLSVGFTYSGSRPFVRKVPK
jgi:hypothetical protein